VQGLRVEREEVANEMRSVDRFEKELEKKSERMMECCSGRKRPRESQGRLVVGHEERSESDFEARDTKCTQLRVRKEGQADSNLLFQAG